MKKHDQDNTLKLNFVHVVISNNDMFHVEIEKPSKYKWMQTVIKSSRHQKTSL